MNWSLERKLLAGLIFVACMVGPAIAVVVYAQNALWISGALQALMLAVLVGAYILVRFHLAARARRQELQNFIDAMSTLALKLAPDGTFLAANKIAVDASGLTREEYMKTNFLDGPWWKFDPEVEARVQKAFRKAASGTPVIYDEKLFAFGKVITINFSLTPIRDEHGDVAYLIAEGRDVSPQKEAELALKRTKEEAESAQVAADRANRAKSEFLSRMSHELRTPLNAILGFSQLMEMGDPPEQFRVPIAHIIKAGRHLLDLINEVLDIARIEAGRMSISVEPVRLRDVIEECVELIRPMADQRSIRIEGGRHENCDHHVLADRQRLKQALLNLLSNAVKFNREGGSVSLSCEEREDDRVGSAPAGSPAPARRLRLSIADTGFGIPAAELPRLFGPFERLGSDLRGIEGTGLGLALTKHLIELMGASIAVESEENRGSVFSLEFNIVSNPVPRSQAATVSAASAPAPIGAHTVLYVEDNLSNLQLIEHVMTRRPGVKLVAAMQGSLGLDLAREHRPHLILLDLNLPDIPGREVLRRLRAEDTTRDIPVVIISADATPGEIQRMIAAGASAYLTKPLDLQKFLNIVDEHLRDQNR